MGGKVDHRALPSHSRRGRSACRCGCRGDFGRARSVGTAGGGGSTCSEGTTWSQCCPPLLLLLPLLPLLVLLPRCVQGESATAVEQATRALAALAQVRPECGAQYGATCMLRHTPARPLPHW